jgi:hypothetical protein
MVKILASSVVHRGFESNPRSTTLEARILTITLLRQGLEPTMYHTRGENLNHYTTETGLSSVMVKILASSVVHRGFESLSQ